MPYKQIPFQAPTHYSVLADKIADEIKRPDTVPPVPSAPTIIEEQDARDRLHVTVFWDDWQGINPEVRGRIILDAYKSAFDTERMLQISIAMGLTRQEAQRLGVEIPQ